MNVEALYADACAEARELKGLDPGQTMPVRIACYRGHAPVAMAFLLDNDSALNMRAAVHTAILGFRADRVSLIFEGWHTDAEINPDTGKRWDFEEMGAYVAAHGRGLVNDSIMVTVATAGDAAISGDLPFTEAGGELTWLAPSELTFATGAVPTLIAHAFNEVASATAYVAQHGRGEDVEAIDATADAAAAKVLTTMARASVMLCCLRGQDTRLAIIEAFSAENGGTSAMGLA